MSEPPTSEPARDDEHNDARENAVGADAHPRSDARDPWAHRRGEPRVFAFLWTMYLLVCVLGSSFWLSGSLTITGYGPSARLVLLLISLGCTVIWPMVRFSQLPPDRRPLRAAASDFAIIALPVQLTIWPLALLASWPIDIAAGVAALLAAWSGVTGGIIANRFLSATPTSVGGQMLFGILWMMIALAAIGAAPTLGVLARAAGHDPWTWLPTASPFTAIYEITGRGRMGVGKPVADAQWIAVLAAGVVAIAIWIVALLRMPAYNRERSFATM